MDLKSIKTDTKLVEAGRWVDEIPNMGDLRLNVRGMTSKLYTTKLARLLRAVPKDKRDRTGAVLPDEHVRCMGAAAAETLLIDWENLTDEGKPVAYTKDLAVQLLTDTETSMFLDAVLFCAQVVDNESTGVEDAAKN
jgi:hypothetical protein